MVAPLQGASIALALARPVASTQARTAPHVPTRAVEPPLQQGDPLTVANQPGISR